MPNYNVRKSFQMSLNVSKKLMVCVCGWNKVNLYKDGFRLCYIKTCNNRKKVGGKNISKNELIADFIIWARLISYTINI